MTFFSSWRWGRSTRRRPLATLSRPGSHPRLFAPRRPVSFDRLAPGALSTTVARGAVSALGRVIGFVSSVEWDAVRVLAVSAVALALTQPMSLPGQVPHELPLAALRGLFAFVLLVPLLDVVRGRAASDVFRKSLFFATVYFAVSLHWLAWPLHAFFRIRPPSAFWSVTGEWVHPPLAVAFVPVVLMAMALALFWAAALTLAELLRARFRISLVFTLPVAMTAAEFARNAMPGGFSWLQLGYALLGNDWLAQSFSLAGIYGMTFLIAWVNAHLAVALAHLRGAGEPFSRRGLLTVGATLLMLHGWGALRIAEGTASSSSAAGSIAVSLLQGNIDQRLRIAGQHQSPARAAYTRLIDEATRHAAGGAAGEAASLIVWPEAAWPEIVSARTKSLELPFAGEVTATASALHVVGLVTSENAVVRGHPVARMRNAAAVVTGAGDVTATTAKTRLVPFGEKMPFGLSYPGLAAREGTFVEGESVGVVTLPLPDRKVVAGVMICYEAGFPEIAREQTSAGAQLLIHLTNDAWYGASAGPLVHLAVARARAIENKRFVLRATNNGLTSIIDPFGRVVAEAPFGKEAVLRGRVVALDADTLYLLTGDLLGWLSIIAALVGALAIASRGAPPAGLTLRG